MKHGATIMSMIAVFIFSVGAGIFLAAPMPQAQAYAVGSLPPAATNNYSPTNSLENLFSPFTNFLKNLAGANNTTINVGGGQIGQGGQPGQTFWPAVNLTPTLESGFQDQLSQWLGEFDNWVYQKTGVQLSGIFFVLLNAISWTLGLAQGVVNWLLGLFH